MGDAAVPSAWSSPYAVIDELVVFAYTSTPGSIVSLTPGAIESGPIR